MEEAKPPDDLLQIALQHQDVEVVRTLLAFTAGPANIVMDELFKEEFNAVRRPRPTPHATDARARLALPCRPAKIGPCRCLKHTLGGRLGI